jgi:hypothetical protein
MSVLKQIADLERMSAADLQHRWRELIGTEPPRYNREFLVRRLAHRLQELAHGGLSQAARAKMDALLDEAGYDEIGALRASRRHSQGRRDVPVEGTRLVRGWNDERHEVTVVAGGFEYGGRRYRSLTAVATAITGTHWNGPAFFGLRSAKQREVAR